MSTGGSCQEVCFVFVFFFLRRSVMKCVMLTLAQNRVPAKGLAVWHHGGDFGLLECGLQALTTRRGSLHGADSMGAEGYACLKTSENQHMSFVQTCA